MSLWGFQSESYMTTVSAVAKLIPKPPARVDNKNAKWGDPGAKVIGNVFRKKEKLQQNFKQWILIYFFPQLTV